MNDITSMGAAETARAIATGEISAGQAVEARIARIEAVNGRLNAVVWERFAEARDEAREIDRKRKAGEKLGALAGVPITIKESIELSGSPSTFGLPDRAGLRADKDDGHVARLREAGAVVLGKTNIAQMLLYFESDNPLYGRTLNPWNEARSCGGSSGGEAAIIAARGSALGLGTDLGGSGRIPAAFCGVASIKPTAGRCPDLGRFSYPMGQTVAPSQISVFAGRVEDVALGLQTIDGGVVLDDTPAPALCDPAQIDLSKLTVGYCLGDGTLAPCPAARRAVGEAAAALASEGATVFEWRLPRVEEAIEIFYGAMTAGGRLFGRILGDNPADPRTRQLLALGAMPHRSAQRLAGVLRVFGQKSLAAAVRNFGYRSTEEYWLLVERIAAYRAAFAAAMDEAGRMDLILLPANALPALPHGETAHVGTIGAYTILFNLLGYPAGVVPVARVRPGEESERRKSRDRVEAAAWRSEQESAGLPIAVQVAGRMWREDKVLAAMRAIEDRLSASSGLAGGPPL